MTEYLNWVLLTLALLVNFSMIGICAIFYFCWSKVFWREKRIFPITEKMNIEKTKDQPPLLKKDLEAAQFENHYLSTQNSLGSGTSGPYYVTS